MILFLIAFKDKDGLLSAQCSALIENEALSIGFSFSDVHSEDVTLSEACTG